MIRAARGQAGALVTTQEPNGGGVARESNLAAAMTRASQDVPPSVFRWVWRRFGGRCCVPGCRSARGIECHHLKPRSEGGSHDPSNLILLCSSCHAALHAGLLILQGTIGTFRVRRPIDEDLAEIRRERIADYNAVSRGIKLRRGWLFMRPVDPTPNTTDS
jgi:hypothetical protein